MILTPSEYAKKFLIHKKQVSSRTVLRMCQKGLLPSEHKTRKIPGGLWVIEVPDAIRINGKDLIAVFGSCPTDRQ